MGKKKEVQEEEYLVEVLLGARPAEPDFEEERQSKKRKKQKSRKDVPKGRWEYLVKWYNYDESENSWEPEDNLGKCERLLASFWKEIGMDDGDYTRDTILEPSVKWIAKEKKRFAREQQKGVIDKEKSEEKKKKKGKERAVSTNISVKNEVKQESSLALTPLTRGKRSVILSDESELSEIESTDSDAPLSKRRKVEPTPVASTSKLDANNQSFDISAVPQRKRKRSEEAESAGPSQKQQHTTVSPSSLFGDDTDVASAEPLTAPPTIPSAPAPSLPPTQHKPPPPPLPKRPLLGASGSQSKIPPLPSRPPGAQIKPNAPPPDAPVGGSGLSTKQRLAQGALTATAPRKLSTTTSKPSGRVSPVRTGSKTLMPTGFRSTSGIAPTSHAHHEPTLASLNATPGSPTSPSMTGLPQTMSPTTLEPPPNPFDSRPSLGMDAADEFLQSVMPPELAGPLEPAPERLGTVDPRPPPSLRPRAAPPAARPSAAPYQWQGPLTISAPIKEPTPDGPTTIDTVFNVVVEDDTNAPPPALRFSILLKQVARLETRQVYNAHDVLTIIPACKTPVSFGRMTLKSSAAEEDMKPWKLFIRFLAKAEKAVLLPLCLDGNVIAHLMVATPRLFRKLNITVPAQVVNAVPLQAKDTLVACILPWTLTQAQIASEHRPKISRLTHHRDTSNPYHLGDPDQRLKGRPRFQEALRQLSFPPDIFGNLFQTTRSWKICPPPQAVASANYETTLLKSILAQVPQEPTQQNPFHGHPKQASRNERPGIVFIHVGALPHLNKIPQLRSWLESEKYARIYTYGSHPAVYKKCWGVREIFPCGGVMTFTPSTLLGSPYEIRALLRRVKEHPFWVAYILPSVLGMLVSMARIDETNLDKSPYSFIFKAIENGDVALIEAPPDHPSCYGQPSPDRRQRWLHDYLTPMPPSAAEALSMAKSAFASVVANRDPRSHRALIESAVGDDIARMRRQPAIMADYRRYVVVASTLPSHQDLTEWTTPSAFHFTEKSAVY